MRARTRPGQVRRITTLILAALIATSPMLSAQQPSGPLTIFRASRDVVSIDVVVRDRTGALVRDLSAADFDIREDGQPQEILTSSFQEVDDTAAPAPETQVLQRLGLPAIPTGPASVPPPEVNGRRLMLLLFDLSAMEPEEVERGVQAAMQYVDTQMSNADLVAVATLTWELRVLTDFTSDRTSIRDVLGSLVSVDTSTGDTAGADPADSTGDAGSTVSPVVATEARLRALRLIADALSPIAQKKALLYFTAGLGNSAQDTPAELRAATAAATKANLAIYPVDTRGLQAIVPSGPARVASRGGEGLFSGRDVNDQFNELTASQDTMVSMASATGGRMFSGVNDVSAAFARVRRDTAAYYLLGYSSANTARDGRFRRVQVRVKRDGLRVESRAGYYGDRDFAHTSRADREAELDQHLSAPSTPSALKMTASTSWVAPQSGQFQIPITLTLRGFTAAVPGRSVPLDVLGTIEDEQGRVLARIRDTVDVPASADGSTSLAYGSNVTLPPGRYVLKSVMRENVDGTIGRAQTTIVLPLPSAELFEVTSSPSVDIARGDASRDYLLSMDTTVWDGLSSADPRRPIAVAAALFRDSVRVIDVELFETSRTPHVLGTFRHYAPAPAQPRVAAGRYVYQVTAVDPATGRVAVMRTDLDIP